MADAETLHAVEVAEIPRHEREPMLQRRGGNERIGQSNRHRAWTVDGDSRFLWLLAYPGGWVAFEEADRGYHASPQRAALDPNPARLIEEQTTVRLAEVER